MSKYNPLTRSRSGREKSGKNKHEIPDYKSRVEVGSSHGLLEGSGGEADVEFVKKMESVGEVASLGVSYGKMYRTVAWSRKRGAIIT